MANTLAQQTMAYLGQGAEVTESDVLAYLADAESAILMRLYPYGVPETYTELPLVYQNLQIRLAIRYINRRGGEGETEHSENGIGRVYGSVNDEDLLMEVVPYAKVI